jgi:dephospho-CoA kinase
MIIIGVTGDFGSGKSTVAAMLKKRGARVIEADVVVRRLLEDDDRCRCAIRGVFGDKVVTKGEIDRSKLAAAAFSDRRLLRKLEKILHPLAKERVLEEIGKVRNRVVVLDVPLLIEAGWHELVDAVIVVRATVDKEVARLGRRSGYTRTQVLRRLKHQLPFRDKRKFADFIIDNRGSLGDTDKQVKKIFESLIKKNR